jgi:hypothetical protein
MRQKSWYRGAMLVIWQAAMLVVIGAGSVRANATCSVDCDNGKKVTCSVSGTGCSCEADSDSGCTAACVSGGDPDDHKCSEAPLPE